MCYLKESVEGRTHLVVCKCKGMSTFKEERGETRRIVNKHKKHHDWIGKIILR
jgi:hypothetical protein